jgi:hypothetical protein
MPTPQEIINLLTPLIVRFPHLPMENVAYNRNFVFAINKTLWVKSEIPDLIKDFELKDNLQLKMNYVSDKSFHYDQEKLNTLEQSIANDIENLSTVLTKTTDLQTDIQTLKHNCDDYLKPLKQLVRLSPILYDAGGEAISQSLPEPYTLPRDEINQLQALYTDLFKEHLAPLLSSIANIKGLGDVHKITRNTLNQHIPRVVIPATTLYSDTKSYSGIQGYDSRWFDFFIRAQVLMPDMPELATAVTRVYYDRSLVEKTNLAYYELASLYRHGLQLGVADKSGWLQDMFDAQDYDDVDKSRFFEHFNE